MLRLRTIIHVVLALLIFLAAAPARAVETASPNDTARFLAGMPPASDSPLAALTNDHAWREHARSFDSAFGRLENHQLGRIRAWSAKYLTNTQPTVLYLFSGPDFVYANAIFPRAKTYVLAGLEPVGTVPDLTSVRGAVATNLRQLHASLGSILAYSFFITKHMKTDLRAGRVNGTLPILYVFLARSGKTILDVSVVSLDDQGNVRSDFDKTRDAEPHAVKIVFAGDDGEPRTLYYFSTNLANDGVKSSHFLKFCAKLGPANGLIKSASYLLHSGGFSVVRDFLLANSSVLVQDDSGIPLAHYDAKKWDLQPFGHYRAPLGIFPGTYQASYSALFKKSRPIEFGIGYRWRPNESNLLIALKTSPEPAAEALARATSPEPAAEALARVVPEARNTESSVAQPASHRAVKKHSNAGHRRTRTAATQRARSPLFWFASPWSYHR